MRKNLLYLLLSFIFGAFGGIFSDQILWPYLIERPLLYQYHLDKPPIYLTETKQVTIQENTALQEAVAKVEKTVIALRTKLADNSLLEGSGIAVTNDGLVITLSSLAPKGENLGFFVDEKPQAYQILKRDAKLNLVLVKLNLNNLATTGFAETEKLKLGERVFLIKKGLAKESVNEGIITSINEAKIETNIFEKANAQGSPIFDIEGSLVGLANVALNGSVSTIPTSQIKIFTGL
jgi:S1-C subfamily serine protease